MEQKSSELCREQAIQLLDFACEAYRLGVTALANDLVYKAEELDGDFVKGIPLGVPANKHSVLLTGVFLGNVNSLNDPMYFNMLLVPPSGAVSSDSDRSSLKTLFDEMLDYGAAQPVTDDLAIFLNEEVLKWDKENTVALFNLGCVNLERAKSASQDTDFLVNRAVYCFGQIVQIEPDFKRAHYHLGECYCRMSLFDQAFRCFEKELEINPRHADSHILMGRLLERRDPDRALVHADKAFAIAAQRPDDVIALQKAQALKMHLKGVLKSEAIDFRMN